MRPKKEIYGPMSELGQVSRYRIFDDRGGRFSAVDSGFSYGGSHHEESFDLPLNWSVQPTDGLAENCGSIMPCSSMTAAAKSVNAVTARGMCRRLG